MRRGHYHYIYSRACAIQMTDSVILTGGLSRSRVQEYNLQGSVARLPDLNIGRQSHACGHYVHQGKMVSRVNNLAAHTLTILLLNKPKYCNIFSAGVDCQWRNY